MLTAQNAFNFSDSFNAMGKMLTTLKWKKQDTVPYMQYELSYEIILIFIHWKKKTGRKCTKHLTAVISVKWDSKILSFSLFGNFQIFQEISIIKSEN